MHKIYNISFPKETLADVNQDESYFYLDDDMGKTKIRFHDYDKIYQNPGLYEQLFYKRLKCSSPAKIAAILESSVKQSHDNLSELRVLDLGAGNGMMGEELMKYGISRLIGVDILKEAYAATVRDRPGVYDAYYVEDFVTLSNHKQDEILSWECNCLVTVAALGFGDIPKEAFINSFNSITPEGWVAFNIRDTFFNNSDKSGFSQLIRELIFSEILNITHIERYRHRLSIDGKPLYYFAISGRKMANIPMIFYSDPVI